jgi:hypothetical protein
VPNVRGPRCGERRVVRTDRAAGNQERASGLRTNETTRGGFPPRVIFRICPRSSAGHDLSYGRTVVGSDELAW